MWNHDVLEHWDREIGNKYPRGISYRPPDDLPSRFYPRHGIYSSSSTSIIQAQLKQAKAANIKLLVVPFTITEEEAKSLSPYVMSEFHARKFTDQNLPKLLKYAEKEGIRVGFLIEDFRGRDNHKIFKTIKYLIETYNAYKSFFPIFYIYDAHHVDMKSVLSHTQSDYSVNIRKWYQKFITEKLRDGGMHEKLYVISSWVNIDSGYKALEEGYDGLFTYFASDAHSYGSNASNWKSMNEFAASNDLLLIPSVSPGYDDVKVRPWNSAMTIKRYEEKKDNDGGQKKYFLRDRCTIVKNEFSDYLPKIIFINSFNDWISGTQIEPATAVTIPPLEKCNPGRKSNRMCRRLQRQLNIDGKYYDYAGGTTIYDHNANTIPAEENLDGIDELLETSTSFLYLQLTKECINDTFQVKNTTR